MQFCIEFFLIVRYSFNYNNFIKFEQKLIYKYVMINFDIKNAINNHFETEIFRTD